MASIRHVPPAVCATVSKSCVCVFKFIVVDIEFYSIVGTSPNLTRPSLDLEVAYNTQLTDLRIFKRRNRKTIGIRMPDTFSSS